MHPFSCFARKLYRLAQNRREQIVILSVLAAKFSSTLRFVVGQFNRVSKSCLGKATMLVHRLKVPVRHIQDGVIAVLTCNVSAGSMLWLERQFFRRKCLFLVNRRRYREVGVNRKCSVFYKVFITRFFRFRFTDILLFGWMTCRRVLHVKSVQAHRRNSWRWLKIGYLQKLLFG